jgi:hypothetical protein
MATIGRLVELLREESWAAKAAGEQATGERLWEMAEDPGDMSAEEVAWVEQATDDQLRGRVAELRADGGYA